MGKTLKMGFAMAEVFHLAHFQCGVGNLAESDMEYLFIANTTTMEKTKSYSLH